MKRTSRRHRNPHLTEKPEEPFFSREGPRTADNTPFFQAKGLMVGKPGDKYEKEADAVADAVVNHSGSGKPVQRKEISSIQRDSLATPLEDEKEGTAEQRMEKDKRIQEKPELQLQEEEEEELQKQPEEEDELQMQVEQEEEEIQMQEEEEEEMQMKTDSALHNDQNHANGQNTGPGITEQLNQSGGKGRPLTDRIKNEMESAFGHDFGEVRIHTGKAAEEMNGTLHARAFTHGKDIYFNRGKYNPETTDGKKLIAHELTHVIQQKKLKRKHLHMDREGGASPQGGLNETQISCPDSRRLDEIEQNYRSMIASAREGGHDVAADNLEFFLNGSGTLRSISVTWLRGFPEVLNAEEKNRQRFQKSLENLADAMSHGDRRDFNDYWDAMLTASVLSELYYASGTSTIRSTGSFNLERIEDIVRITGTVEHKWHDPYDWHAGLGAYIPGHGTVSDEDGLIMQSCRGAKPFQMESIWTQRLSGTVNINEYWFNSSSFSWSGPD